MEGETKKGIMYVVTQKQVLLPQSRIISSHVEESYHSHYHTSSVRSGCSAGKRIYPTLPVRPPACRLTSSPGGEEEEEE